jgi:16S rRNA (adenine1518-N6/adenine1519-N6)-dimethyltransferase
MLNLTEIKEICKNYHITPTKSRGQNFLFDANIIDKIINSSNLSQNDTVLEIGPGLGVLTERLVEQAGQVRAVELDKKILEFLRSRYKKTKNIEIIEGDILRLDINTLNIPDNYKIVANLPYNITSNFIRKFLEASHPPTEMVIMVQREVAQRMVEQSKMSLLSLAVQFYANVDILFEVSRNSFWPSPKVDSAIVRIVMKKDLPYADPKEFFRIIKMGFAAKRKQLQNNLAGGLGISKGQAVEILVKSGLNEKVRAQDLSIDDWIMIIKNL